MDPATLIGLIAGAAVVLLAVLSGSGLAMFVNIPGLLIVLGGSFATTLIKFSLADCYHALVLGARSALFKERESPHALIARANELAAIVRKNGLLALEDEAVDNEFFAKGVQLCADGHPGEFVRKVLESEMDLSIERHEVGERVFRAVGDSAPAFGMIGTLVGLVQMLAQLQDPASIGPAMAVALLTTLYGALIANGVAMPLADKLAMRLAEERKHKSLILESVLAIQQGQNPRVMDELLESYLPSRSRAGMSDWQAASEAAGEAGGKEGA